MHSPAETPPMLSGIVSVGMRWMSLPSALMSLLEKYCSRAKCYSNDNIRVVKHLKKIIKYGGSNSEVLYSGKHWSRTLIEYLKV